MLSDQVECSWYCIRSLFFPLRVNSIVKTIHLSEVHDWWYTGRSNEHVNLNIVVVHKCLVSNSIDIMFEV